jgi:chromosome segregation ATPase
VTSLAPPPDDPLLVPLLGALGLPMGSPPGSAGSEANGGAGRQARGLEEALRAAEAARSAAFLGSRLELTRERARRTREELAEREEAHARLLALAETDAAARAREFEQAHSRVEERFARFFTTLVGGGEVSLPLSPARSAGAYPGMGVSVHFPGKPLVPLAALSGGQLVVVGLCLALAVFLEVPSPALVLDEVEPALDEALVRRLTRLLGEVGRERQIVAVSHQPLMRYTAGQVMMIERKGSLSRIGMQYDPKELRGPGSRPARA